MSRIALLVAIVAAVALARAPKLSELESYTFEQFVVDFHRPYAAGTTEYARRKATFNERLAHVLEFNAAGKSYKKGINHFSDQTLVELMAMNGRLPDSQVSQPAPSDTYVATGAALPDTIDYRNASWTGKQVLTAVKDQGQCGSCWAHASTESVETHYALATGELYVLSQQQMTSCVNNSQMCGGNGGCGGATAQLGWEYLQFAGGQTQEWMYGYSSYFGDSGECLMNSNFTKFVQVNGYTAIERNSDAAVAEALALRGPLAISVDASSWPDYHSGIFDGCNYSSNISMDHAVQLIGYGFDSDLNQSYWLVRNSWSAAWGENGYIRLKRTPGVEECGWNVDWITNGGGCQGGPNTVWACGMCGILYDTAYPNIVAPGTQAAEEKSKAWIAGAVIGGVAGAVVLVLIAKKVMGSSAGTAAEGVDLLNKEL